MNAFMSAISLGRLARTCLASLCLLACVARASADSPSSAAPAAALQPPPGRFSLGAGLGVAIGDAGFTATSALAGLGATPSRTPFGTSLAEVMLTSRLRLVAGITGSYTKQTSGYQQNNPLGQPDKGWACGGTLGVRYVLNPGAVVEVSPLLSVGGFKGQSNGTVGTYTDQNGVTGTLYQRSTIHGYDARLGLVLEYALLANLFLRFESYFMRAGYTHSSQNRMNPPSLEPLRTHRGDVNVAYGVSPTLQLRLVF